MQRTVGATVMRSSYSNQNATNIDPQPLNIIDIPESKLNIEDGILYGFKDVRNIAPQERILRIPYHVTEIADNAFIKNPHQIKELHFAQGGLLTTIGMRAFDGCSAISNELILPNSVTTIYPFAFRDCHKMIGGFDCKNLEYLGMNVFDHCFSMNGKLVLHNNPNFKIIGPGAFRDTAMTGRVYIPNCVERIGADAFKRCSNLQFNKNPDGYSYSYTAALPIDGEKYNNS
jgi:hypothetical protein